jgi:hypothetical protein
MQKISISDETTINFKVKKTLKSKLFKQAALKGMTLSEYMRHLSEISTENNLIVENPFAELIGTFTDKEAEDFNKSIYTNRINKNS